MMKAKLMLLAALFAVLMLCMPFVYAEEACAHPAESLTCEEIHVYAEGYGIEQYNGDYHRQMMRPVLRYACSTCGTEWDDPVSGVVEQILMTHVYEDGNTCLACGYVNDCPHEETITVQMQSGPISFYDMTVAPASHTYTVQTHDQPVCADCGASMGEGSNWVEKDVTAEHMFTDGGVCFVCKYVGGSCEHANSKQTGGHKENSSFARVSETEHLHTFDVYWDYKCEDCGETYSLFLESGWEAETHAFLVDPNLTACNQCGFAKPCSGEHVFGENGICTSCGYCPHTQQSNSVMDYKSYTYPAEQYDDDFHVELHESTLRYLCEACGTEYGKYNVFNVYLAHKYDDNGVCACGVQGETTTCTHANIEYKSEENDIVYADVTKDGHTIICDYYSYVWCKDCESVTQYELMEDYARTRAHTFEKGVCACGYACEHSYADGVCTVCGTQQATCAEHSYEWSDYASVNGTPVYEDEQFHLLPYTVNNTYVCSVCGDSYVESTDYETHKAHEYDENGLCACGAQGVASTCEHPAESKERKLIDINIDYQNVTADGHTKVSDLRTEVWCTACNTCRSWQETDSNTVTEEGHTYTDGVCACSYACEHSYVDGVCSVCGKQQGCQMHVYVDGACRACGHVSECAHANAEHTGGYKENETFTKIDSEKHLHAFDVFWKYSCADCGEAYAVYVEPGTEEDNHAFFYDPSLTACNQCGAVKPCEEHSYVDGVCDVCGAVCAHDWAGGTCMVCGSVCGHDWSNGDGVCGICGYNCWHYDLHNVTLIETKSSETYYDFSEDFHSYSVNRTGVYRCNDCAVVFENSLGGESYFAGHTFDADGLCACGRTGTPTTCAHEHTDVRALHPTWTGYKDKTMAEHTHIGEYFCTCTWCTDCGICLVHVLEDEKDEMPVYTTEKHTYVNGICEDCGYAYLDGLTEIYRMPADLTEIEAEAFIGTPVEAVIVSDSCVKIGAVAFADCAALKVVVLPESVVNIASDAFTGCPDVVIIAKNPSAAQAYCDANRLTWVEMK